MMAQRLCEEKLREMVVSSTTGGFCYSDVPSSSSNNNPMMQTHLMNQIQAAAGFVSDPEMFNLTTGMEMIGFSKNLHQQQQQSSDTNALMWKSFFSNKHGQHPPDPSSSKTTNETSTTTFYDHQHHEYNNSSSKPDFTSGISETTSTENLIVGAHHHHHDDSAQVQPWQEHNRPNNLLVDDSSLRCVFPCEGNERPSQGLSLSLSSSNPSSIGLQSFELRQTSQHPHNQTHVDFVSSSSREGFYGKSDAPHQHHMMLQAPSSSLYQGHFVLKNSKYLVPAQELLNEFCSLGIRQIDAAKQKSNNKKQWEEEDNGGGGGSGSSKKHTLTSLEFVELQKRKTKLLSMLEELDRRYKHYRNQMKAVVSSFEAVAGNGAATVYSALALKAMSKYFRNLKDAIMGQIQVTRKAMGEKDPVAPGTTRGETPRLKVIDQAMRQQRAFQQMSLMETHPWRPQRGLPERSVSVLRAWLFEHFLHPYPSDVDKHILARQTGLSRSQVSNWFINARVRLWKPMVEEMYTEELKDQESIMATSDGGGTDPDLDNSNNNNQNVIHHIQGPSSRSEDQKPIIVSESATSILNKNDQCLGRVTDTFGSVELDFSPYTPHHQGFGGNGGVSLTLGLQQHGHGGNGVSIAFPGSSQSSLFYERDQIEDCTQPAVHHQYSLLDGEAQNLPYRNLMGAQLLHDLAG